MSTNPLVSVVIPTFNRYDFLKETVSSILAQTYGNIEVIIISDNSSDETSSIIDHFNDERCHFYGLTQKSSGPAAVRNYGLSKCKGSLIAFCDDDDLWTPDKLQKQVAVMNANTDVALVATNVRYFSESQNMLLYTAIIKNFLNRLSFIPRKYVMAFYNCIVISSALVRKDILDQNQFNEGNEYQGHEDLDLWLTLCSKYKAIVIPEYLTIYRIHPSQISTASKIAYKKQALKILRDHFTHFDLLEKSIAGFRLIIYKVFGY